MLELKEVSVGYDRPLIQGATITLKEGHLVALLGRNGSGKSTLLRHIAGWENPREGSIWVGGKALHQLSSEERAKWVSIVNTTRIDTPYLSAYEVVALGRSPYTNRLGHLSSTDKKIIEKALKATGVLALAERPLTQMSDGERQRIMVARALAQETPIVLLDEPTAFLDLPNRYELALLLRKVAHEEGKLVLFSTHELDIAFQLCDKVMLLKSPHLITLGAEEMKHSGYVEDLFCSTHIRFDPIEGRVLLQV